MTHKGTHKVKAPAIPTNTDSDKALKQPGREARSSPIVPVKTGRAEALFDVALVERCDPVSDYSGLLRSRLRLFRRFDLVAIRGERRVRKLRALTFQREQFRMTFRSGE